MISFTSACHRLLLRLYPQRFRDRHGPEVRAMFDVLLEEEAPSGRVRRFTWCLILLVRTALAAGRLRIEDMARRTVSLRGMGPSLAGMSLTLRVLRRQPGYAAAAIATLALGIGANAAVFGVVDALLLRPLPYASPERVVEISGRGQGFVRFGPQSDVSPEALRTHPAFSAIGVYFAGAANLTGESAARVSAAAVSPAFFDVLGVQPSRGRVFTEADLTTSDHIAVISDRLWRAHFRRDPLAPGKSIVLDGSPFTVLGVMPPRVSYPANVDVWVPTGAPTGIMGQVPIGTVVARVRDEVDIEGVRDLVIAAAGIGPAQQATVRVIRLRDALVGNVQSIAIAVWIAAALVLAVACINTTNLLLARVSRRHREFMVRGALGASRRDLMRQVLGESLLLSMLGAIAAIPAAMWTMESARVLLPQTLHGVADMSIDVRTLLVIGVLGAGAALLFSLGPALSLRGETGRDGLQPRLGKGAERRWSYVRSGLLVAEIAIALVLLAGAAALVRSVQNVMDVDMGVRGERALTLELSLTRAKYQTADVRREFYAQVNTRLRSVAGVEALGLTDQLPGRAAQMMMGTGIGIEGHPPGTGRRIAVQVDASGGYFAAIGNDLLAGRVFTAEEDASSNVVVVSEGFARVLGLSPVELIGRRLVGPAGRDTGSAQTIAGVVRDVRLRGPEDQFAPVVYLPFLERAPRGAPAFLVVKAKSDPMSLLPTIRAIVRDIDREVAVSNARTFEGVRQSLLSEQRLAMFTVLTFAALAVTLAVIGLYGVISYVVQMRSREIGIRLALGASRAEVCATILRNGMTHVIVGLTVGGAVTIWLLRATSSRLATLQVPSAGLLFALAAVIGATAAIAIMVPAWRAARIDPAVTLRAE